MHMATVVITNPDYSPDNSEEVDICSHCDRPLCPHCWNHADMSVDLSGSWICTNPSCGHKFEVYFVEV